jgi:hypothetical protein
MTMISFRIHVATALMAASLSAAALAQVSDKLPTNPGHSPAPLPAPASLQQLGAQTADGKTAVEVRLTLTHLVNAGFTEGRFHDLLMDLARQDRDRIGDLPGEQYAELNKAIALFRQDFRAKYKQEFELRPEHLKDAQVNIGPNADSVTVLLSDLEKNPAVKPLPAEPAVAPVAVKPGGELVPGKDAVKDAAQSVVAGPTIHLVREGKSGDAGIWKVTIPNQITGKQLKENLTLQITKLEDQKSVWTDDPNATARAAATAVLRALNDSTLASDQ